MSDTSAASVVNAADHDHGAIAHVMPVPILLAVFASLVLLTVVTVAVATPSFELGSWNLWIALLIATVKASLVAMFFMHLRYDNPFYSLIFVAALFFLAVFLGITLLDATGYQPEIDAVPQTIEVG